MRNFWAMLAEEYTAGAEFMMGLLFTIHGVRVAGLFSGLLPGNRASVASWV